MQARTIQRRPATMSDATATKGSRRRMLVAVGLLAAVAVLALLVPPSALSDPPGLTATEISSASSVGRASAGSSPIRRRRRRSRSAPAPGCGRPAARAAVVHEHVHVPRRGARRGVHRPRLRHRGALRRADAVGGRDELGDPAQREQRGLREAHSRAYTPPRRGRFRAWARTRCRSPASTRSSRPRARPPRRRRATARTFGSSRWAAA